MEKVTSNIDDIYLAALEREATEERSAYLEDACAGNSELRRRVEQLLKAQQEVGSFLEFPAPEVCPTVDHPISERPGTVIGRYKLLQQIGEGGMGVVFMAEQTVPLQRTVALKIIKPGMDTRQVIARFEAERQALALMDHPNIARVIDAGTTNTGRPYFVMDLVKGVPITSYCDKQQLSVPQRLELMSAVCYAVQHAHQKGIIHRDLKPTNVLVAEYDGQPVPKIIDFGVAKATAQRLTEKTMFTEYGQLIGTFEYMSPEQARFNQLDVDTRSDIFALGVLLYEVLAGSTPLEKERLRSAAFDEVRRIICEEEPPRPSIRLSTSKMLPSISAQRHIEPAKLKKLVRGELDWIVMKCLEKDRNRRYETASALAADLEHYLANEPVEARPMSHTYRLRKFIRRNKAGVLAGSAIVTALAMGLAIASIGFVRARTEAARSQQVAQFLKDMLAAAGPSVARGRDATLLREILDKTAKRVGSDLKDRPEVQGDLWFTLGNTYEDINDYPSAITMFQGAVESYRTAFGDQNTKLAIALAHLGRCQSFNKDVATGKASAQLGLAMARRCHDPETLASCLLDMARSFDFWDMGTSQGAQYAREAVELRTQLGNDPVALADCLFVQASTSNDEEAIPIYRQLLALHRQQLGPDHPKIANDVFHLGERLWHSGKFKEAEPVLREAVELYRKVYTEDQPQQSLVLRELVETMIRLDEWKDAKSLVEQAAARYPSIQDYGILLGDIQAYEGKWSEAAETFTRTQTGDSRAVALLKAGRNEEYRRLRHEYLARDEEVPGTEARFNSARAALLLPLEQFDLQHAYDLADIDPTTVPEERYHYSLELVKALAEYRRENFKSAVDLTKRVLARKDEIPKSHQAQAWFIQSLAYIQLGQREQAIAAFTGGDKLVNLPNRDLLDDFLFDWSQWSIAELLCLETREALRIAKPRPTTDPQPSEDEVRHDK